MEIHAGEGGQDSKLFVYDLMAAYVKYARRNGLQSEILSSQEGSTVLLVSGNNAFNLFAKETGKHCVQRVPPTERGGRTHTSIISVAILPLKNEQQTKLNLSDVEFQAYKGSGPGGQARNKLSNAIRAIHKPTGMNVCIDSRSQFQNKKQAVSVLAAKLEASQKEKQEQNLSSNRQKQLGGMGRSDKFRTYNFKKKRVVDHRTGNKTTRIEEVMNGRFDLLTP